MKQTPTADITKCLACGSIDARVFFELNNVPVLCNAPCATRDEALQFPVGQLHLAFCPLCGHVFNRAFIPELLAYDQQYENSLHFSGTFDSYIRELANSLVDRYGLRGKNIIEIGCGKGDFLALLCELGDNHGIGFDPSYEAGRLEVCLPDRIEIIQDLYTDSYSHLECDFLCSRQTLEHIREPAPFLKALRGALRKNSKKTVVFFEVPNALYTIRHKGIWDIIYEHVSYFWSLPLSRLFAESGFRVTAVQETYGGQYLWLECFPDEGGRTPSQFGGEELEHVSGEVLAFGNTFRCAIQAANGILDGLRNRGHRTVVWGTGSKGVTFMNLFRGCDLLEYAVDINPHKQGRFVPGSGQEIVAPELLRTYKPDAVLVMNPLYREEIRQRLAALSVTADLIAV